jgi:nuclear pore complex protein Nup98-Nup96
MPAYSKWSTEELRLVDYAQGRKYGNQNGQPGAFGQSTGFGGFGATTGNTTGFGSTAATTGGAFGATNTSTPFGGTQNTSSGFGASNTGGGLFGAKPAGSTLFGAPAATSAPAGGSLFGGTTGTSFGGAGNTTGFGGTAGGSGFGQTQQPKPAFGAFGSGTATSTGTTGGLFASSGNTAFGGTATNTGFGGTQQNTGTGGFSFGQQNQNQQQQQGQTGGSLFGGFGGNNQQQQQQKPGGLFASTNTGGLFNNQPQQQQQQGGGGLFGNNNNNTAQQGGGLFGAKPAGTGLFANTGGNTGGGGLFGNQQQQQQPQAGGLFSSTNNQQQNTGLFGNRPATASTGLGGSLFSSQQQQQPAMGGSLFGGSQQQQQPTLGGSLFAGSQQQNQPTHLVASLTDNPYGNAQLFAGLQTPTQSVGPLATPLSSSQKTKKQAVIPHYRMMPNASSRLITPQKRPQGFGFSYSTYGTPGSAVSNASPMGLGNSLLGGSSIGRSLGKSLSTSNLRHSFTANESILQPGAFSGAARNGTGSMKKLNINRGLSSRHSLFGTETPTNSNSILSKKVSFENGPNQNGNAAPSRGQSDISGALVRTETGGERPASSTSNGQNTSARNLAPSSAPEMSQVNGSTGQELAIVPENGSPVASRTQPRTENDRAVLTQRDQTLGPYYTEPSISQLQAMSRDQRSNITDFKVGRDGSGSIVFHKVDLTNTPLEQIAGGIVILEVRTATVYGEKSPVPKPPQGGGLNVPSTIVLQNSWPRAKGGRLPVHERLGTRHDKHVVRLKRIQDTEFVNYNSQTGEWTFKVQHYTTYGLDYDDDDSIMTGAVSNASETPTPMPEVPTSNSNRPTPVYHEGESMLSSPESSVDDTFDFKKGKRKILPGQFEDEGFDEDEVMDEDTQDVEVLDGSSQGYETEEEQANGIEGHDMAGSFPAPAENTERHDFHIPAAVSGAVKPKSILKDTHRQGTPSKAEPLVLVHDWTEQLQHTASPKKRDRNALREVQTAVQPAQADQAREDKASKNNNTKSFGTNLDIMRSLFAASEGRDSVKVPEVCF